MLPNYDKDKGTGLGFRVLFGVGKGALKQQGQKGTTQEPSRLSILHALNRGNQGFRISRVQSLRRNILESATITWA